MVAGLIVFVLGKKALRGGGEPPKALAKGTEWAIYGIGLRGRRRDLEPHPVSERHQWGLVVLGIGLLGYVLYEAFKLDPIARTASSRSCS
jgi:POT family proton-dependent oligopeptide transporter